MVHSDPILLEDLQWGRWIASAKWSCIYLWGTFRVAGGKHLLEVFGNSIMYKVLWNLLEATVLYKHLMLILNIAFLTLEIDLYYCGGLTLALCLVPTKSLSCFPSSAEWEEKKAMKKLMDCDKGREIVHQLLSQGKNTCLWEALFNLLLTHYRVGQ